MKRILIAILILSIIWAASFFASYMGLWKLADASYNYCFDNAGKWYTK